MHAMLPGLATRRAYLRPAALLGALALGASALGCASHPPPPSATPDSAAAPGAESAPVEAEPAPAPSATVPASEPSTSSAPEPAGAEPGTRDARGKDEIQAVVAANRDKVRACYDKALQDNPGIKGDLVVSFVINPDGTVKQAEVNWAESDLHVPELDTCATEVIKGLQFPASSRGLESKVDYPFNFNPPNPHAGKKPASASGSR